MATKERVTLSRVWKPMKAAGTPTEAEQHKLKLPQLISPKYDGIRALIEREVAISKSMKALPSAFIQERFANEHCFGFDGEMLAGAPNVREVYGRSFSAVMTHGSRSAVCYYVFDLWTHPDEPYNERLKEIQNRVSRLPTHIQPYVKVVPQKPCADWDEIMEAESGMLADGYEGAMLRSPTGIYKYGQSTLLEGHMTKLKRFFDEEAEIIGAVEMLHNANEPIIDVRGYTTRSTHKDNKVPMGILGAWIVRHLVTKNTFNVGSGIDYDARKEYWEAWQRGELRGMLCKYRSQPYTTYTVPRHPIFLGLRHPDDL